MSNAAHVPGTQALAFGPFRLFPVQRLLLEDEQPIRLGSRALDILVALVERAGEVVAKEELIARAWPNTVVDEAALRVHVAALRKVLSGESGIRYVENVSGRGYRFVAPLARLDDGQRACVMRMTTKRGSKLPPLFSRVIGRAEALTPEDTCQGLNFPTATVRSLPALDRFSRNPLRPVKP